MLIHNMKTTTRVTKLPFTEYVHCMSIVHFILPKTLQGSWHYPPFTNDKPKAQTRVVICLSHKRTTPGRTKTLSQHSLMGHPVTALQCLDGRVWGMCILYPKCQCSTKLGPENIGVMKLYHVLAVPLYALKFYV